MKQQPDSQAVSNRPSASSAAPPERPFLPATPGAASVAESLPSELAFEPVPVRHRRDGWTPERQRLYVAALARWGSGRRAAAAVGLSEQTAARLRLRPGAGSFRRACEAAYTLAKRRRRSHVSSPTGDELSETSEPSAPASNLPPPVDLRPAAAQKRAAVTQSLAHIALLVRDYDEAIAWFTQKLGFTLVADSYQPEQDKPQAISAEGGSEIATSKRWVLVAPPGAAPDAATLLLARAATPEQEAFIGNQAGGRVFLFLNTDHFDRDYEALSARGVRFVRPPATHPYGKVAVFEDLYGNLWDLIQFAAR
jgi:catechol 2,3-dioxygenase-like lactoylglutathione lyase family enzyme